MCHRPGGHPFNSCLQTLHFREIIPVQLYHGTAAPGVQSKIKIKSVIDHDGCKLRKQQPFWTPKHFECPLRWTLYDVFKSVAHLCFTGPFAILGKAKHQYRPLRSSRKPVQVWERWQTDGRTDTTKCIISSECDGKTRFTTVWPWPFVDLNTTLWPTTLTYNPSLISWSIPMPKIKIIGQTVQTAELGQTNIQTHKQTDTTKRIISPASRSITIVIGY